jgi:DNA-binding transcriptional regulator YhcF (GntR family)
MVQGRGSFVTDAPPPSRSRSAEVRTLAAKVAAQAQSAGIGLEELAEALRHLSGRAAP